MNESPGDVPEVGETSDDYRFAYSASLRIHGTIPSLDEVTKILGVAPTHTHRIGDFSPWKQPYKFDLWCYQAAVPESEPLAAHIDELWRVFRDRKDDLLQLKERFTVDVFLGYRSDCDHAGFEVPCRSLEMFVELQLPLGFSVIVF